MASLELCMHHVDPNFSRVPCIKFCSFLIFNALNVVVGLSDLIPNGEYFGISTFGIS